MTGSCRLIGVRNDQRAIYRIRYDARMVWGTSPSSRVAACALVLVGCAVPVASPRDPPGQPLATVEAMKMENILRAEKEATVAKINAGEGDSLAVDEVILELE